MRTFLCTAAACVALFGATTAQAQFANRSLGVSVGYFRISDSNDKGFDWAVPLSLEASLYIESGFDVVLRVPLMLVTERITGKQTFATGGQLGIRYLFSEESLRPYFGIDIAYLHVFREQGLTMDYVGLGPHLGVDYFVSESVSIGARGYVDAFWMLNQNVWFAFGGQAVAATYF